MINKVSILELYKDLSKLGIPFRLEISIEQGQSTTVGFIHSEDTLENVPSMLRIEDAYVTSIRTRSGRLCIKLVD